MKNKITWSAIAVYLKKNRLWLTICFGIMLFVVAADQIAKTLVVRNMNLYDSKTVIPHVLNFSYVQNDGAAFGGMSEVRPVFMILSALAIIGGLIFIPWRIERLGKLAKIGGSMLVGGGIGNMVDRVGSFYAGDGFLRGWVVDFIDFNPLLSFWNATFNIADIGVTVGVGIIMFVLVRDMIKEYKIEKRKKESSPDRSAEEQSAVDANAKSDNE